jgi:hypothetical protein
MKMRRATQIEHSPFGVQVAFARTATGLGIMGLVHWRWAQWRLALWRSGC